MIQSQLTVDSFFVVAHVTSHYFIPDDKDRIIEMLNRLSSHVCHTPKQMVMHSVIKLTRWLMPTC